jgi:hypothetical protein
MRGEHYLQSKANGLNVTVSWVMLTNACRGVGWRLKTVISIECILHDTWQVPWWLSPFTFLKLYLRVSAK